MAEPNANNYSIFAVNQRSTAGSSRSPIRSRTPALANLVLVWTSGANGSLLSSVRARPRANIGDAQLHSTARPTTGRPFV